MKLSFFVQRRQPGTRSLRVMSALLWCSNIHLTRNVAHHELQVLTIPTHE